MGKAPIFKGISIWPLQGKIYPLPPKILWGNRYIFLIMMREGQKTDTIKLYVDLIGKLKRGQPISLGNKMLSTELRNIPNGQLKIMLEAQSLLHNPPAANQIEQLTAALAPSSQSSLGPVVDAKMNRLLVLKVQSIAVSRAIQKGNPEQASRNTTGLLKGINALENLRFVLQIMFRVRSLTALLKSTPDRIRSYQKGEKETKKALWVVALVKANAYREQSAAILKSIGQSPAILDEKKLLVTFLGEMLKKQKELARSDEDTLQRSVLAIDNSTRTVIKHSIQTECRIIINENNPRQTFARINNSLEEQIFLHAYPLTQFYFQKNYDVIEAVRHTELFKSLITSKSYIVPDAANNSYNSVQSRSKSKPRTRKNPNAYEDYLKADLSAAQKCVAVCRKGLLFHKHNYGNLKSSTKFVRVTEEKLEYFKTAEATGSPTTWDFSEILCVVYGKTTPRQVENEDNQPQNCFSIVMKDRSLDLSIQITDKIQEMFAFMRGLTFLLGEYRERQQEKAQAQLKGLKDAKKSKQRQLGELIRFHEGKIQNMTVGGLLWSQLILASNSHTGVPQNGRASKMQGLRRVSSKLSGSKLSGQSRRRMLL